MSDRESDGAGGETGEGPDVPPFFELLGIEVTASGDGHAEGHVELRPELSTDRDRMVAHGAVAYALADTVGGAAAMSVAEQITPTVDMRVDYLQPATGERLVSEAEVVRAGGSVATVDAVVTEGDGEPVATTRGVYKTGGSIEGTPWGDIDTEDGRAGSDRGGRA